MKWKTPQQPAIGKGHGALSVGGAGARSPPRRDFPDGAEVTIPQGAAGNLGTFGAGAPSFITFD
eukprot:3161529-Lingulodinium_polyedra.AAC.1